MLTLHGGSYRVNVAIGLKSRVLNREHIVRTHADVCSHRGGESGSHGQQHATFLERHHAGTLFVRKSSAPARQHASYLAPTGEGGSR
jgi:hypothetical protein